MPYKFSTQVKIIFFAKIYSIITNEIMGKKIKIDNENENSK